MKSGRGVKDVEDIPSKKTLVDDPLILQVIMDYLHQHGLYQMTLSKLKQFVQRAVGPKLKAPCHSTLSKILRSRFY